MEGFEWLEGREWQWSDFDPDLVRIEEEEDYVFIQPQPAPMQPQPAPLQLSNQKGKSTKSRTRDYMIDSVHLSLLVSSYHKHFDEYSNVRKKSSNQIVPALVWKNVYLDYKKEYPNSPFKEDSLKERLRATLVELKTGTSNEENAGKAMLQPSDFLDQLKATDGHAKRNTLKRRHSILDQLSPSGTSSVDSTVAK